MNLQPLRHCIAWLAILLLPAAAWASASFTPPALVSVGFVPGSVDVSSASQTVSVTVRATDGGAGIASVYCSFRSPSGNQTLVFSGSDAQLVSGTPLNGEYCMTATLASPCAEPGTWTLETVSVADECGNTATYASSASGSTLAFPFGTPTTLNVINSNPDVTVPTLASLSYTPQSVDLTGSSNSVTVTAELSDPAEGVGGGYLAFVSPSGTQTVAGSFDASNLISGNQFDGVYQTTVSFNNCDQPGTWTLESVSIADSCDSQASYGPSETAFPMGTGTALTVTNPNADTTPPALASLALSATTADVSNFPQTITVTAVASDNSSGVNGGEGYYMGPTGKSTIAFGFANTNPGVTLNGTFSGSMYIDTCAEPGVYTLGEFDLYDNCNNKTEYTGSKSAFPGPKSFLVINGTLSTGSLVVDILPAAAEFAGQWNVDGGNSQYSGFPVTGLSPGLHEVAFLSAFGFTKPANQFVTVHSNQTAFTSGTYVSTTASGSVQVTILNAANGQWNVDNGPLQPSAATVGGLANGSHTIEFTDVGGYTTPPSQIVMTTSSSTTATTGTYTQITQFGSLTVTLSPTGAIADGGKWNVDGGPSQSSGATAPSLPVGSHLVNFLPANGYSAPGAQAVVISQSQVTATTGTYTVLASSTGSLTVKILPTVAASKGATWNVDGGLPQKSGARINGLSGGNHEVNFTVATGFVTPASQEVAIVPFQTAAVTGTYTLPPGFTGAAESFVGLSSSGNALLTLTMGNTGKFTGKLVTAGVSSYSLSGSFSVTGTCAAPIGKPPTPYYLRVTGSTPGTYGLTGSASGNVITAYPDTYAKGQTAAEAGTYTALLGATGTGAGIPQGSGYATLKVSTAGVGSLGGKLADGTAFSASDALVVGTGGNALIVFDPNIYNKKGLLSGVFTFGEPGAGQFGGTLVWQKPAAKGPYYAAGFDTSLSAAGALYNKGAGVPFMSGTVTFGGVPGISVAQAFTVSGAVVSTGTTAVKLSIKSTTGAVSGTFKPAGAKAAIAFSGLLLQDPGNASNTIGAGYFLSPAVSGTGFGGSVTLP